jgi:hypothetical protein
MLELHWSIAPLSVRLFLVYVSLVVVMAIVRALTLMWRFFSVRARRMSFDDLRGVPLSPESFAASAMANRVRYEATAQSRAEGQNSDDANAEKVTRASYEKAALRNLKRADSAFRFAAQTSEIEIALIRKLLWLTVLLSVLLVTFNTFVIWRFIYEDAKITGLSAFVETIRIFFGWLSFSFVVCVVLHVIWSFLDGVLRRRQACWQYFCSRAISELSD